MAEYLFTLDFQRELLASTLSDPDFVKRSPEIVKPEYFSDEILAGVAAAGIDLFIKHGGPPSKESVLEELRDRVAPGRKYIEYSAEVDDIYSRAVNRPYYIEQAVKFARSQALANALRDGASLLEAGEYDEIGRLVDEAVRVGDGHQDGDLYEFFAESKSRVLSYIKASKGQSGRLPTGFGPLDVSMQGGLAAGELGVFVALPKHGKTTALVNVAASALERGKSVAYVTLELSQAVIASKFDSLFFGSSLETIRKNPSSFARKIVEKRDELNSKLYIIQKPTKSITPDNIASIVRRIGKVDLLCVDYGQLVKAPRRRDETYHELTDTYESLRRIAGELGVPVWTAHQSNRPGTDAKVIMSQHIAGDFNIAAIVDVMISINQTEEESIRGALRLYNMGSRLGPSGDVIECRVNWRTSNITVSSSDEALQ